MSTPSNPQSVQQPEHDQINTADVITLVDHPDSTSDEEMTDLGSDSDEESPQKFSPVVVTRGFWLLAGRERA